MRSRTWNTRSLGRWLIGVLGLGLVAGCALEAPTSTDEARWIDLFDGETLEGWTQVNGDAPYSIRSDAIRGTNVLTSPNSFLATDAVYSDFVLEFESRSIGDANSGVQFRTELAPGTWSGVVGYQLDIDPTDRRWTGGIYHEGVHVWRHSMARNAACQAAYEHGAWNAYRIEAVGNVIATWVNGVPCAHMVGDHHAAGFIALQVHAIGEEETYLGSFTEWRAMRLLDNPADSDLWHDRRSQDVEGWLNETISDIETQKGWRMLDLSNGSAALDLADSGFEMVVDLQLSDAAEGRLTYQLGAPGRACLGAFAIADDAALSESVAPSDLMGGIPGKVGADNLSEPGRPKRVYSDERWNRVRLIVTSDRVEHWLNSVKVIDVARCDPNLMESLVKDESDARDQAVLNILTGAGEVSSRGAKYRVISD